MHLRPLIAAAIVVASAAPAFAQSDDPLSLLAKIAGGFSDGGKVALGSLGVGAVSQKDKVYTVTLPSAAATFTFDQPKPCVFTEFSQMAGQPNVLVRFNLANVKTITFADQGPYNGLNAVAVQFAGNGDLVQLLDDKGAVQATTAAASVVTSLKLDDLNAAAGALQKICPPAK